MKIGLFIGAFNPIHKSHEKTAESLLKNKLDKIIYVPCGDNYNKPGLIEFKHRYNMLKLIVDNKKTEVSNIEEEDYLYTYEILNYFKELYHDDEIYLIIGSDNYNYIQKWKNADTIINDFKILVVLRNNDKVTKLNDNTTIIKIDVGTLSSTKVRELLSTENKKEVIKTIDKKIYDYIIKNNLYKNRRKIKSIVEQLVLDKKTIAVMESCTGGYIANAITNIDGASDAIKFSAVTYSNEYKIKMGVNPKTIKKYTVYSLETAREMALAISKYAKSDYGIGITGKLNKPDKYNQTENDSVVYIAIYNKKRKKYIDLEIKPIKETREENKQYILDKIILILEEI